MRTVCTFFYGSYMNLDVLREVDIEPTDVEVARLDGFELTLGPLANLRRADGHASHGIIAGLTHAELDQLYAHAREVLGGVYLPEPVLVTTRAGEVRPALTYIADDLPDAPAKPDYVERILAPARELGLPADYLAFIESFR